MHRFGCLNENRVSNSSKSSSTASGGGGDANVVNSQLRYNKINTMNDDDDNNDDRRHFNSTCSSSYAMPIQNTHESLDFSVANHQRMMPFASSSSAAAAKYCPMSRASASFPVKADGGGDGRCSVIIAGTKMMREGESSSAAAAATASNNNCVQRQQQQQRQQYGKTSATQLQAPAVHRAVKEEDYWSDNTDNNYNSSEDASSMSDNDWILSRFKRQKQQQTSGVGGEEENAAEGSPSSLQEGGTSSSHRSQKQRRIQDRDSHPRTEEDDDRRQIRRERNKMAAARCRQRRVDLTNQLLAETESLEDQRGRLEKEVQSLQRQKNQLEYVLDAHTPRCQVMPSIYPPQPLNLRGGNVPTVKMENMTTEDCFSGSSNLHRPNSLAFLRSSASASSSSSTLMATPQRIFEGTPAASNKTLLNPHGQSGQGLFDLDLDSMLDGHTGLTPITGMPSSSSSAISSFHCLSMDTNGGGGGGEAISPTTLLNL